MQVADVHRKWYTWNTCHVHCYGSLPSNQRSVIYIIAEGSTVSVAQYAGRPLSQTLLNYWLSQHIQLKPLKFSDCTP